MFEIGDDLGMQSIGALWVFAMGIEAIESIPLVVLFEHVGDFAVFLSFGNMYRGDHSQKFQQIEFGHFWLQEKKTELSHNATNSLLRKLPTFDEGLFKNQADESICLLFDHYFSLNNIS